MGDDLKFPVRKIRVRRQWLSCYEANGYESEEYAEEVSDCASKFRARVYLRILHPPNIFN